MNIRTLLDAKLVEVLSGHVKIAVAVSGGIDSATILFHLTRSYVDPDRLCAFTAVFGEPSEDGEFERLGSELVAAKRVADYFGVEHVAVEITADGFLEELDLMQKFFRNPRYNVWPVFLFKAAREWGSQILITGEGADEIFGYPDRSYLEGWAGQLEWVQPAWVASATATGMQLLQPYLALALGGDYAALYMPPTKERLRELYVDLLPDWILLAASKPPSHPFYAMMAQAWGVAAPSPNYRTFEVVKRKMQLLACQAWIDAWKGSA